MKQVQLAIIGGGPAGLAAAIAAREKGVEDILIIERDKELGGILNQCIHAGFGLHTFGQELTGPEYAGRFISRVQQLHIPYLLRTMVLDLSRDRVLTVTGPETGLIQIQAQAVILAMGCRERPRGALNIPGYRPAGIYSAGTAQRLVNMEGFMPGKNVVILGSGDIGLIMARRMTLEGAKVHAVAEVLPYSGGLKRNIVQCLEDFDIPLYLSTTVVDIHGRERLEGVTLARVDENRRPIPGTEQYIPCDTLLLSVGLLPENELSSAAGVHLSGVTGGPEVTDRLATSIPGVFACGNVLHVHDLVDFVSQEAQRAGENAALYLQGARAGSRSVRLEGKNGVRYTVPQSIDPENMDETVTVRFRVAQPYRDAALCAYAGGTLLRRIPKRILTPGEMEQFPLRGAELPAGCETITFTVEEVAK
ncbi:MAG: FAD-dependent oxidoreductase [Firmicutes bacterium]|nr:FAD-dependent oxidoreductase [Bacillota bacterium]